MRLWILLVTCLLVGLVLGQDTRLEGTVTNAVTGDPVPFASVSYGKGKGVSASIDGFYALDFPPGKYEITFTAVGYKDSTRTYDLSGIINTLNVALVESKTQLDAVVVSAGRFEQTIGEVAVSLNIIEPELIRNKSVTNIQDALDQTPGVVVVNNDPQIRGSSGYSFGAGSRVQILIDDLPVLSGDVGRPSWSFLPLENVEQVEVIKGASSVLYGSAALSGVINLRTAYPKSEPQTRVSLLGGVRDGPGQEGTKWWDENRPTFSGLDFFHSRRIENMDLVLGGNLFSNTGYIGPEPIPADSIAADPLRLGSGEYEHRIRVNFNLRWKNRKVEGLIYGIGANAMDNRNSSALAWNDVGDGLYRPFPGTVTRTNATIAYVDPFVQYYSNKGAKHSLRTRLFYLNNRNDNEQSNQSTVGTAEYQYQHEFNLLGPTKYTVGLLATATDATSELFAANAVGAGAGENEASNQAGYVQLDRKLFSDRATLTAGVRYEQFRVNEDEESVPVFRAGGTYRLLEATYLRSSWGQGFRFPTIGERFIQTSVGQLNIFPSLDLVPERSWNLEFGVKQGFKIGNFQGYFDAVWFQQEYTDYIEFTFGQWGDPTDADNLFGLGFRSVNTGDATVSGYEFEVAGKGKIGAWEVMVLGGYTHTDPVSTTPDEVYAEPPFASSTFPASTYANTSSNTDDNVLKYRIEDLVRFDLQLNKKKWGFGFSTRYNSHVRNIDLAFISLDESGLFSTGVAQWQAEHTTGDLLFDARVSRKLTDQIKLAFIVDNLTNEVYAIRPLYIEAPRTFTFRLSYQR